jgi:hypothetical protein
VIVSGKTRCVRTATFHVTRRVPKDGKSRVFSPRRAAIVVHTSGEEVAACDTLHNSFCPQQFVRG